MCATGVLLLLCCGFRLTITVIANSVITTSRADGVGTGSKEVYYVAYSAPGQAVHSVVLVLHHLDNMWSKKVQTVGKLCINNVTKVYALCHTSYVVVSADINPI